jgi:hypothetical protein
MTLGQLEDAARKLNRVDEDEAHASDCDCYRCDVAHEPCAVLDCPACGGPRLRRNGDAFEAPREPYRDLYSTTTGDVLKAMLADLRARLARKAGAK